MRLLFIEPFFGGSHRQFAEGLQSHSSHTIDLLTLPSQNWAWRIHGSALYFAEKLKELPDYDGIITSSMMRLSDFKVMAGISLPPVLVYFHESQLTYPVASGGKQDTGLIMADITTALAGDRLLFNSQSHLTAFIQSVRAFMERAPDCALVNVADTILAKSAVLSPGLSFEPFDIFRKKKNKKPLVIWNHRWSYDKNAPSFFYAVDRMIEKGIDFELALLGESSGWVPDAFEKARKRLGNRLVHFGYIENRKDYISWLINGDLAVSTANQENFGISMVEAMKYGCLPLLPNRLSYPEILPINVHSEFLYSSQKELLKKMEYLLLHWNDFDDMKSTLSKEMNRFSWGTLIDFYDREIDCFCTTKTS